MTRVRRAKSNNELRPREKPDQAHPDALAQVQAMADNMARELYNSQCIIEALCFILRLNGEEHNIEFDEELLNSTVEYMDSFAKMYRDEVVKGDNNIYKHMNHEETIDAKYNEWINRFFADDNDNPIL